MRVAIIYLYIYIYFGNCSVLVQFWCSHSTVPVNVIVTQVCLNSLMIKT